MNKLLLLILVLLLVITFVAQLTAPLPAHHIKGRLPNPSPRTPKQRFLMPQYWDNYDV